MKINIIYHDFSSNVVIDAEVLSFIFKKFKEKPKPVLVNVNNYNCEEAEINIFIEKINYCYFSKAKYNIFIPNQQYLHKNQLELLNCFDAIFAKSNYTYDVLKQYVDVEKIEYIGWRSPDIYLPTSHKSFDNYLVFYQDPQFYPLQSVIDLWEEDFPNLNIVMQASRKDILKKEQNNITYYDNKDMDTEKFHSLFNKCGVHLCLTETDSFNHFLHQCKIVKSIPIAVNGGSMKEIISRDYGFPIGGKKKKLKQGYGSKYIFDKDILKEKIKEISNTSEETLKIMGNNGRQDALRMHSITDSKFKDKMLSIFKEVRPLKINKDIIKDKDLPTVSIITPTHNRLKMFPLAILNFNCFDYPREKLEWIIVDDSNKLENIRTLLPSDEQMRQMRIQYHKFDQHDPAKPETKMTIGAKRNFGISKANHDVIICMDDDDYYPPSSIKERVSALIRNNKKCVCCTTLGCFHITRFISIISSGSLNDEYYDKLSEASLGFYKSFWEYGKFNDSDSMEAENLVKDRISDIVEIPFTNVINSLIHRDNTSTRSIPPKQTANGCHFGWSEKLFKFITQLSK